MDWNDEFERLCGLDVHPELRHLHMNTYFTDINVRYVLQSLVPRIDDRWPDATKAAFRAAATTAAFGTLDYDQFLVAVVASHQALETALRQRFEGEHPKGIPMRFGKQNESLIARDLGEFNAFSRERKAKWIDDPEFNGSYSHLVRWCRKRGFLSEESEQHATVRGWTRNELHHSSSDNRLAPGHALRELDCDIAIAREVWFGEPAPWDVLIPKPPPEVIEELRRIIERERAEPND